MDSSVDELVYKPLKDAYYVPATVEIPENEAIFGRKHFKECAVFTQLDLNGFPISRRRCSSEPELTVQKQQAASYHRRSTSLTSHKPRGNVVGRRQKVRKRAHKLLAYQQMVGFASPSPENQLGLVSKEWVGFVDMQQEESETSLSLLKDATTESGYCWKRIGESKAVRKTQSWHAGGHIDTSIPSRARVQSATTA